MLRLWRLIDDADTAHPYARSYAHSYTHTYTNAAAAHGSAAVAG